MKSLFKKSLLVLMVAFIAVFTLSITNKVVAQDVTITFDNVSKRTVFNTSQQVWVENGITVTNDKGSSTSNVADYAKPARFYKSSKLTIEYSKNISKIVFDCNSGSYATAMQNSISSDLGDVTVSSDKVTLTLKTPSNKVVVSSLSGGQVRMDGITISYQEATDLPTISIQGENYAQVDSIASLTANTNNTSGSVIWSSSDTNVATVDQFGNVTAKSMGKTTITATVDGVQDTLEFIVYPIEGSELTIVEALQVCEYTGTSNCPFVYSVSGNIKTIDYLFNESNNNISLTITDGTYDLYSYKMSGGSDLEVGDKIKITGTLVTYDSKCEFSEGSTYDKLIDETLETIKGCLNNIDSYMSFAYKYTHDVIQKEVVTTLEAKMLYTAGTTTNMQADADNSSIVGLDNNLFMVKAIKNKPSNNIGLNKDGTIRLYSNSADGNGNELEISTKNGKNIVSIEIEFASTVGSFTVNGINGDKSKTTYNVDDTKVTIKNTTIGSTTQVHIKSIIIKYESNESTGIFENVHVFTDTDFRIKCGVAKDLANIDGIDSYGVKVSTSSKEEYLAAEYNDATCLYAIISLGNVLTNLDRLDVEFTVQAYVVVEGIIIDSDTVKTMSLRNLIETYYAMPSVTEQVAPLYNLIQSLN